MRAVPSIWSDNLNKTNPDIMYMVKACPKPLWRRFIPGGLFHTDMSWQTNWALVEGVDRQTVYDSPCTSYGLYLFGGCWRLTRQIYGISFLVNLVWWHQTVSFEAVLWSSLTLQVVTGLGCLMTPTTCSRYHTPFTQAIPRRGAAISCSNMASSPSCNVAVMCTLSFLQ